MEIHEFERLWLRHFAADISPEDMEKYVVSTGNYIWHIFSWKLLPPDAYLAGDAARKAYNEIDKSDALYIEPFFGDCSKCIPRELHDAAVLDGLTEVYVVARDFSWTYIKTHENDLCGPYFYKISMA